MFSLTQVLIAILAAISTGVFATLYWPHFRARMQYKTGGVLETPMVYDLIKHSKKTISIAGQTFISHDILAEAEWCPTRRDHIVTRISAIGGPALYGDTQQKLQRALVAWARWRYKGETLKQFVESCGLVSEGMALSQLHETTIHVNINADAAKATLDSMARNADRVSEIIRDTLRRKPEIHRALVANEGVRIRGHRLLYPSLQEKCRARFDTGENFRGFCPREPYMGFAGGSWSSAAAMHRYASAKCSPCTDPECASHKKRLGTVHAHLRRMGRELTKWSVNWDKRPVGSSLTKADMAIRTIRDLRRRAERGRDLERELANTRAELAKVKRELTPPLRTPAAGSEWRLKKAPDVLAVALKDAIDTVWKVVSVEYAADNSIVVTLAGCDKYSATCLNCTLAEFREYFA